MLELAELDLRARAGVAQYEMERRKPGCGYISVRVWTRACSSKLSSSSFSSHFVLSCSGSVTFFLCLASSIPRAVLSLQVTTPTSNLFSSNSSNYRAFVFNTQSLKMKTTSAFVFLLAAVAPLTASLPTSNTGKPGQVSREGKGNGPLITSMQISLVLLFRLDGPS